MLIAAGQPAPEFTLKDQDQRDVKLSDFRGKHVVILFYPLDWSPVCTDEHACFMSSIGQFNRMSAQVLGLSVDSTWSHKAFAEKMGVSYPLLADFHPRGAVADKFGIYHPDKGITGRAIVIVGKDGNVAWARTYGFGEMPSSKEVAEALAALP